MVSSESKLLIVSRDCDAADVLCSHASKLLLLPVLAGDLASGLSLVDPLQIAGIVLDQERLDISATRAKLALIRAAAPGAFVIQIAPRLDDTEQAAAFICGIDDCFEKPINETLLEARLSSLLNRFAPLRALTPKSAVRRFRELELDARCRIARYRGESLELTPTEFLLLELLTRTPGIPVSLETFGCALWGWDSDAYLGHIRCHISRLRSKLARVQCRARILSVRGMGYALT